jgi:hypothetical protein
MTERTHSFFKDHKVSCLGMGVFTVCALFVFSPVLAKYVCLLSPDSMPFFPYANRTVTVEGLLTGAAFTPHTLYWLLLNPLYAHELTYIIDSLTLALAGVYYLSGRRALPLAAWCGGLALGLSGYTFTLFCAGHRGYFHMFSCAVWSFGLLIRCFDTRKLFYFAMLGLVIAWGVPYQPDVLVFVMAVAAAYALWLTFSCRIQKTEDRGQRQGHGRAWENVAAVWPRFAVSVAVLALAGFGGIRSAVTTQIFNREAQIAGVAAENFKADTKPEKLSDVERHTRWIFATNWSLPPEDVLEFFAPGVFGNESMHLPHPYWGRIGRPSDEVFQKGRMMPNYRGHTVYLGVVSVLFALFGTFAWFSSRRGSRSTISPPSSALRSPCADTSDIPFWCGVWAVCLVLAMGRYTPVYRLFYAIPYMEYIRCPVKFHHLVEVATAFLAGFGVDAFLRALPGTSVLRRRLVWLAAGLAVALALGAGLMLANKAGVAGYIGSLGMGQAAAALSGYAVQNLMRSACLAALVAALAYASVKGDAKASARIVAALLVVWALDLAFVAHRYVKPLSVGPLYAENAVVKAVKKATAGQVANVINYATPNAPEQDWFSSALIYNGVQNMMPTAAERGTPYGKLFEALQPDTLRLWQALNVQFVIVPREGTEALIRSGKIRPVIDFKLGSGVLRQVQPGEQSVMLAAVSGSVPGARVVTQWLGGVAPEQQAEEMAQSPLTVSDAPGPAVAAGAAVPAQLKREAARGVPLNLETRLTCTAAAPALVLFNDRYSDAFEALVDGRPVPCYRSDGVWASAIVPAGTHRVVLRKKRDVWSAILSTATSLGVVAWGLLHVLGGARRASGAERAA